MKRARAEISKELLHYRKLYRAVGEPKYDFSAERFQPRRRKRCTTSTSSSVKIDNKKEISSTGIEFEFGGENSALGTFDDIKSSIECPTTYSKLVNVMPDNDTSSGVDCNLDQFSANDTITKDVTSKLVPASNPYESMKIDVMPTYLSLLLQENAATMCNYSCSAFFLQDFDIDTGKLKRKQYIIVQRRGLKFVDSCEFVFWCSCDAEQAEHISTLHTHISKQVSEFNFISCIHIRAVKYLLEKSHAANDISPEHLLFDPRFPVIDKYKNKFDCIFPIHDGLTVCLYEWPNNFGVITVNAANEFVCCTCTRNTKSCEHTDLLLSMKDSDYPSCLDKLFGIVDETPSGRCSSRISPRGISKQKVPFCLNNRLSEILRQGGIQNCVPLKEDLSIALKCSVNSNNCPACQIEWTWVTNRVPVVTETTSLFACVDSVSCDSCKTQVLYDGCEDALLNMGTCLVSYDLLRSYLHSFLNGRFPMYTYHKVLLAKHEDSLDFMFPSVFPYYVFRASWYKYIELLDIDFKMSFECPKCSSQPDIIICDATSLAFRRDFLAPVSEDNPPLENILDGCPVNDRVFIPNSQCRKLLTKYAQSATDNTVLLSFSDNDMDELQRLLALYSPTIYSLVLSWNKMIPCPRKYASIVKSLATTSPVCALLLPTNDSLSMADRLASGYNIRSDPELWCKLKKSIPIIFTLIVELDATTLPEVMRPVLREIIIKSKRPFEVINREVHVVCSASGDNTSYYPNLPTQRLRGVYRSDTNPKETTCSKTYRGHPSLLPGIFTAFCPHGVCVGFEVMSSHESPNIPFTLLKTRFTKAPSLVIYDNACSLHTYCLKRDPHFFKETRFLVDRFHWSNHTGCSAAYEMDRYPHLKGLNSEVNEQANASLGHLKAQLSYMTQKNFMDHCRLYVWNKNRLKITGLQCK